MIPYEEKSYLFCICAALLYAYVFVQINFATGLHSFIM